MATKEDKPIDLIDVNQEWLNFKNDYIKKNSIWKEPMWRSAASVLFLVMTVVAGAAILDSVYFNTKPEVTTTQDAMENLTATCRFDNIVLKEILDSISEQYHCSYVVNNQDLVNKHLSFEYLRSDSLEAVVERLNHFISFKISVKDDVITIDNL